MQSPLKRAEEHPRAQRDKLLLSHLELLLMQWKDSGSHQCASSSPPNPGRTLISEHIKPSPTEVGSLKSSQSALYAENGIAEPSPSPASFLPKVSIATRRWRPVKAIVPLINQNQKMPWGHNYIFRLNETCRVWIIFPSAVPRNSCISTCRSQSEVLLRRQEETMLWEHCPSAQPYGILLPRWQQKSQP